MNLYEKLFDDIDKIVDVGLNIDEIYRLVDDYFTYHHITVIPDTLPVTININHIVYHDTPKGVVLKNGDILTIDICFDLRGILMDGAVTFVVGEDNPKEALVSFNKKMLQNVMCNIGEGTVIKEILKSISDMVALQGYYLIPDGLGHGVGNSLHESPFLSLNDFTDFNYSLKSGDRFTLEPIILSKKESVYENSFGVGYVSSNNFSSQFEVTLQIDDNGELEVLNEALIK